MERLILRANFRLLWAHGQPGPHSSIQPGLYDLHFLPSTSSHSKVDGLIVETDPGTAAYLAGDIIVQLQNGNAQTSAVGWAVNDAKARWMAFAPSVFLAVSLLFFAPGLRSWPASITCIGTLFFSTMLLEVFCGRRSLAHLGYIAGRFFP
jgi:hypothetical protein